MAKKKEEKQGIDLVLANLEQKFGLEKPELNNLKIVSTGSLQLNNAMHIGGTAVGKMYEIFGNESGGKSTISIHQLMEYQLAIPEKRVALIDFEHSFDATYAENIGLDTDKLLIYQPDCLEDGYNLALGLIENDIVSCIVLDSQTAATPKGVVQGDIGDATIGLQARLNSTFCLKVKSLLSKHNCSLFVISQLRSAIGSMTPGDKPSGGNAWKFYCDARWKIWKTNDQNNELNKTTIDVIKNKLHKPFGKAVINILWGKGFDKLGELIDYAVDFDYIKKGGAWFTIGENKFQGMDKLKDYLEENYEELLELENKILNKLNNIKPIEEIKEETILETTEITNE